MQFSDDENGSYSFTHFFIPQSALTIYAQYMFVGSNMLKILLEETQTETTHPARHHSNHLHELFHNINPGKEHGTNKLSTTRRIWERSKADARDNSETNAINIKIETASHVGERFSWVSLTLLLSNWAPLPTSFVGMFLLRQLDKSPPSGPRRGPLSCNNITM